MLASPFRIGVDIGGTFTDLVLVDSKNEIRPFKVPSVRANPAEGVIAAVEGLESTFWYVAGDRRHSGDDLLVEYHFDQPDSDPVEADQEDESIFGYGA